MSEEQRLQVLERSFVVLCEIVGQALPPHLQEAVDQLSHNLEMNVLESSPDFKI